jgi:hypothetical protein
MSQSYNSKNIRRGRDVKSLVKPITGLYAISFWGIYSFSPTFAPEQMVEGNEIVPFFF